MDQFNEHIAYKMAIYHEAMAAGDYKQTIIAAGFQGYHFRDDMPVPFTASAYFREWVPLLTRPDSFLLVRRSSDRPTLFLKMVEDYWHSKPEDLPAEILSAVDVVEYTAFDDLARLIRVDEKTAFIGPLSCGTIDIPNLNVDSQNNNPPSLLNHVDYHRAWKSAYELDNMRKANRLAVVGHRAAEKAFREGRSEYEIHMAYLLSIGCRDEQLSYPSIVAINENAAVLHHMVLACERPTESRSMLIDAGAQWNGYAADISRTYTNNDGNACFTALISGVDTLQQRLVDGLQANSEYEDLHAKAHLYIAELLVELDIINVSPQEAVARELTNAFFPHGLGHLIGAQVHDKGGTFASASGEPHPPLEQHSFLRCTRTAGNRMACTIEPGVYFIPMLLQPWRKKGGVINELLIDELLPYGGVRIEDDVVVHPDGVENMTRDAFDQLALS
ncbi:MAG: Xaa-Pro dipeptidase [Halieaceae bacterium]